MEAYRTDEDAARLVAAELERESAALYRENVALATRLARTEVALDGALRRLADAGPGAGRASARRDRTALGAAFALVVAFAAWPLQLELSASAVRASIAVPLLVLLTLPAVVAVAVTHRYRGVSRACRIAWSIGVGLACYSLLQLVLSPWS